MGEMHCGNIAAMRKRYGGRKVDGGGILHSRRIQKTQMQKTGVPYEFSQGTPAVNYLVNFADLSTD